MTTKGIFIFRRDLRIHDNYGLLKLQQKCDIVIPIFCLDKNQIVLNKKNKFYYSHNVVQFMIESLIDLNDELKKYNSKLRLFYGIPSDIIEKLLKSLDIKYVGFNSDFSKYAIDRDNKIKEVCEKYNVEVITEENDYTLLNLNDLLKDDKKKIPFKQFGIFYKKMVNHKVNDIVKNKTNYISKNVKIDGEYIKDITEFYKDNPNIKQHGGRNELLKKMKHINDFKKYDDMHDRLDFETTNISAGLNFGCMSVREVYNEIKTKLKSELLIRQLYWRDYYLVMLIYLKNGNEYKYIDERFSKIKWKNSRAEFNKLWNSQTGFLLIDAAMNEMKITGFSHNRARLLLGAFWTKYLRIDTFHKSMGSQVCFSRLLVDAIGPSQNKMNHQWITELDFSGRQFGKGISGRPMDISNEQIKKFDPDCVYIKKWLPHLKDIPKEDIYKWDGIKHTIHPKPIFDAKKRYNEWFNLTKDIK